MQTDARIQPRKSNRLLLHCQRKNRRIKKNILENKVFTGCEPHSIGSLCDAPWLKHETRKSFRLTLTASVSHHPDLAARFTTVRSISRWSSVDTPRPSRQVASAKLDEREDEPKSSVEVHVPNH